MLARVLHSGLTILIPSAIVFLIQMLGAGTSQSPQHHPGRSQRSVHCMAEGQYVKRVVSHRAIHVHIHQYTEDLVH